MQCFVSTWLVRFYPYWREKTWLLETDHTLTHCQHLPVFCTDSRFIANTNFCSRTFHLEIGYLVLDRSATGSASDVARTVVYLRHANWKIEEICLWQGAKGLKIPPEKYPPWKWMVGIRSFPIGEAGGDVCRSFQGLRVIWGMQGSGKEQIKACCICLLVRVVL